jgi:DAK2 domain fusion protein YloV
MTRLYVDGPTVIRAVSAAVANLEAHVDEVDALNVFPVPDGDTGSNMLATMRAALAEAERLPQEQRDLDSVAEALSRGALTGARGNSGVILSQIIRGMTYGADGRRRANGLDLAEGLRRGSEVAYDAVLTPVEGTILTVIRDAADAAEAAAGRQPHVEAVLADVIAAAASSVLRTPMLLPVLEDAGVVDSGGQGLYRLLEGTLQVQGEDAPPPPARRVVEPAVSALAHGPAAHGSGAHGHDEHAHGYETEYMLASPGGGIDIAALRAAISATGDSVVVAGDEWLARVHVHGERPDAAIAAGLRWGRLGSVAIRDLDDQVAHGSASPAPPSGSPTAEPSPARPQPASPPPAPLARVSSVASTVRPAPSIAIVAVAPAAGFARVLESFGARLVRPSHGSRPSVGEIVEAILAAGAGEVIVLPNDRDALMAARHAASLTPLVTVEIVPTRNAAEGIAAAVAFDTSASLADNGARMTAEAEALRSFSVITAARDSIIDGQPVRQSQVIALDAERGLLASGESIEATALRALGRFEDIDLVTCYHGAGMDEAQVEVLRELILAQGRGVEVEMVPGGQRFDHLLVAVE